MRQMNGRPSNPKSSPTRKMNIFKYEEARYLLFEHLPNHHLTQQPLVLVPQRNDKPVVRRTTKIKRVLRFRGNLSK